MKEYSIERQAPWLVGLPESWEIRKVKHFFTVVNGSTPKSSESTYWGGDITWITPADYKTEDKYICSSRKAITQEGLDSCGTSKVPAGSIIVSNRAPIGSIGIAEKELCTSQGCKSLVKIAEINEEYIYYYFSVMNGPLNMLGRGTTFMELSSNDLANFRLPIPTLKDQNAIVQILNKKIVAINDVINKKANVIELLEEQRISIICSAVTISITAYHAYGLYQFPRNSLPAEHYMFFPLHTLLLVCLNYSSFKTASDYLLSMHAPRSARIIIGGIAKAF